MNEPITQDHVEGEVIYLDDNFVPPPADNHYYHRTGKTNLIKLRNEAHDRRSGTGDFQTDPKIVGPKYSVLLHHHDKGWACAGFKHEFYPVV